MNTGAKADEHIDMHYMIQDITNKKKALERNGHPHWMNDSIQFNRYGDETLTVNIQTFHIKTGEESNLAVMIHLEDLKDAYEVLSKKRAPDGERDETFVSQKK